MLENYKIYRKDRQNGQSGGGSCIYVHKTIQSELLDFNAHESLGIRLNFKTHTLKLLCIYRSPNITQEEQNNLILEIKNLKLLENEDLHILGDFNLPDVHWGTNTVNCPVNTRNTFYTMQQKYLDLFSQHGLTACINDGTVTRRRLVDGTLQESLLDQVLVSDLNSVVDITTVAPLGKSDHVSILVDLKTRNDINYIKKEKECWSKFSKESILQLGNSINWNYSCDELSSNQMWEELHSKIREISDKVPKSKIKSTKNGEIITKLPWDCSALKRKRKEKDCAWNNFDKEPTSVNLNVALHKQGEYDKKQSEKIIEHEKKIVKNMKTNPKIFYGYLNSKRKIKQSVSYLKDKNNKFTEAPKDTADLLADFFASTFVKEPSGPFNENFYKKYESVIGDLNISASDVKKYLLKLNPSKSMGPDEVHPKVLVSLAQIQSFVEAVTMLFKQCYETGSIPLIWKTAKVTALHKKGSKTDPSNYRPISLTCILCKLYETIIRAHILKHVESQISRKQHGFMSGRSCLSNLLEAVDTINDMLSEGEPVDIFYLDFQKAFDTVPHYRLLLKLSYFGISGKTANAISDFLSGRTFNVIVGETKSESHNVTSGIPQGSVLGPLLFVLYINDLPENLKSQVALFADDLKMFAKSSNQNMTQEDINTLVVWQNIWLLKFNTKDNKCKVLHVGKGNPCHQYFMGNTLLPVVEKEKDLGVIVSNDWKWNGHIQTQIAKANSCMAWVSRSVISREPEVMLNIYKTMIRPFLEYCVQLWSPLPVHGNWGLILAIEDIQRRFTRMINGIGLLSYENRLKKLNLTTLLERRARGDLIETFKILSGFTKYGEKLFRISRSGEKLISRPGDEHSVKHAFFARRVICYWNKLPTFVKSSKSINSFKNNLGKFKNANFNQVGNYWELSNEIFRRIPEIDREQYVEFMVNNPLVARKRNINISVTMN